MNFEVPNNQEKESQKESERVFTKEEILSVLQSELAERNLEFSYIEGEKSDAVGIYFLEVRARSAEGKENLSIVFTRKGRQGTHEGATETTLEVLDNDPPIYSEHIATYNEETGEWMKV